MMNMKHTAQCCLLALLLTGLGAPVWSEESADTWEKVVFHVDEATKVPWALMLARSYLDDNPKAKLVVVTYGPGIDFLLEDAEDKNGNPYAPAVLGLVDRGVEFRVCAGTLSARIPKKDVLKAAVIVPSGISEITRLQNREGYAYLKP